MKDISTKILFKTILSILFGTGIVLTFSPILLYWWIHGDYDRYLWIISGPFPYSHFGSGPFQLVLYGCLFLIGVLFFVGAFMTKKRLLSEK